MLDKIQRIDDLVIKKISRLHTPIGNKIMVTATYLGNGAIIWWLALCLPFIIMKDYRAIGINLTLALGLTYVVGEVIVKRVVGRVRPSNKLGDDELIINRPKHYSFPSGHTASSFTAVAVTMLYCSYYVWLPVLLGACIISFSRLYLRVHYLSDVVVGAVLGFVCGSASVAIFERMFLHFFTK